VRPVLLVQTANLVQLETKAAMRLRVAKETLVELEEKVTLAQLAEMEIVAVLANPEVLDNPAHLAQPEELEIKPKKDQPAHPDHLEALAQMPNTVHALVVPRRLKHPIWPIRYIDHPVRHLTNKNTLVVLFIFIASMFQKQHLLFWVF